MSSVTIETELKFKLQALPTCICNPSILQQTYLDGQGDSDLFNRLMLLDGLDMNEMGTIKEVRLRTQSNLDKIEHILTLKSDGQMSRKEFECQLSTESYDWYKQRKTIGKPITKIRYQYPIPETTLILEVDQYLEQHTGLIIAEVEFDPSQYNKQHVTFYVIKTLGNTVNDVTNDKTYKNAYLAISK
jgi:CYTH domain-containing protein